MSTGTAVKPYVRNPLEDEDTAMSDSNHNANAHTAGTHRRLQLIDWLTFAVTIAGAAVLMATAGNYIVGVWNGPTSNGAVSAASFGGAEVGAICGAVIGLLACIADVRGRQ